MTDSVRIIKRSLDLILAVLGLTLAAPFFPLIAALIYLESPGPIFFRQRRAGQLLEVKHGVGGRNFVFEHFEMIKFRTMRVGADKEKGAVLAEESDPRIRSSK